MSADLLRRRFRMGLDLLRKGKYAQAWPLLEGREKWAPSTVPTPNVQYPQWRGEPLVGKTIIVWVEQGFGDQIMFARFATALKERGAEAVVLACRPALEHVLLTVSGVATVCPVDKGQTVFIGPFDYWTRYFSLPRLLGITLENVPGAPYITAPERDVSVSSRVGFVWKTSPTGDFAKLKTIPSDQAQRILDTGAMSLHPEDTGAKDFADTAAMIAKLDLVVTVDTAVAHLAGAMGKPVWVLLPHLADWRWHEGDTTPWYPSARLFRQARPADWKGVVDRVLAELEPAIAS